MSDMKEREIELAEYDGKIEEIALTPSEESEKQKILQKVDITDAVRVMGFGHETQVKISEFSDRALQNIRTRDTGEVAGTLASLVAQLKGFDDQGEKKGFLGIFRRGGQQIQVMKAMYSKVEVNVNVISGTLVKHKTQLVDDMDMLEKLYRLNQEYFRELNVYIAAGEEKLRQIREVDLPAKTAKAKESGDAVDAQEAHDFEEQINRFEKKVHDLRLTRTVSIQMAPQMRLMQNNDNILAEKIQSTLVNTLPLWKSQMVIALGLAHADSALKAEQAVTDMTNELLRKNAEALHQGTVQTAKAAERGVVDIETIRHTNQLLIQTLDEVRTIHADGAAARRSAEKELAEMEDTLKNKLLEFTGKNAQ